MLLQYWKPEGINNWSAAPLMGENTDTQKIGKTKAFKFQRFNFGCLELWLMLSFCKNKALACHMDFSRTGRSALHSSGGHLCLFLRVTECNDELPSTGTAPGTPIVVGMAEQLSPDGKQRMLCNSSSCFMLWESCPCSCSRGICFPIKAQFSTRHKQCWFFYDGNITDLEEQGISSFMFQWNPCPCSRLVDPGGASGSAPRWGGKCAHCRAGHRRDRLSPALELGLHRCLTLFSCF